MKTKVIFSTVDIFDRHYYEFSSLVTLEKNKPLTKLIKKKSDLFVMSYLIEKQNRNIITYSKPINNKKFKNRNIIKFYCTYKW